MTESARESYGGRRWMAMSSGKPGGQARSDTETTGPGSAAASWSSDADVARDADARTSATILAAAADAFHAAQATADGGTGP